MFSLCIYVKNYFADNDTDSNSFDGKHSKGSNLSLTNNGTTTHHLDVNHTNHDALDYEGENIYSSMVPNVCPGKEYRQR